MANYILTSGDDNLTGTPGDDTFDGHGKGVIQGIDKLDGADGNDTFILDTYSLFLPATCEGSIDGGAGTDTVVWIGADIPPYTHSEFGELTFSNVENLELANTHKGVALISGTIPQLAAFSTVIGYEATLKELQFDVRGAGGKIDFSSLLSNCSVTLYASPYATSDLDVTGTDWNDKLYLATYRNTVDGGKGDDNFYGGGTASFNQLDGGQGNDAFHDIKGAGIIDGGDGVDTFEGTDLQGLEFKNVELLRFHRSAHLEIKQLSAFEKVSVDTRNIALFFMGDGGKVDLTAVSGWGVQIYGGGLDSGLKVTATAHKDRLTGTKFNDVMNGGDGDDKFYVSAGHDALKGGGGGDEFFVVNFSSGTFDGGKGDDKVTIGYNNHSAGDLGSLAFKNVETLNTNHYAVTGTLEQFASFETIEDSRSKTALVTLRLRGEAKEIDLSKLGAAQAVDFGDGGVTGGYSVHGTKWNDVLSGTRFTDKLFGEAGNDTLTGGKGHDVLSGGAGDDAYSIASRDNQVVEADGKGWDYVASPFSYDLGQSLKGQEVEGLLLAGAGKLKGVGNELDNVLEGNGFDNALDGAAGDDALYGGSGNDRLTGGRGDDVFVFSTALDARKNVDAILDFDDGDDLIALSQSLFSAINQVSNDFLLKQFFQDLSEGEAKKGSRILYDRKDGDLFYDADGSRSKHDPIKFAEVAGHPELSAGDFYFFL